MLIFINDISEITAPYRSVKRTDEFDLIQNACSLLEKELNVRAVFAYDIREVAAGFVDPVTVKVYLVVEELSVKSNE